MTESPIAVSMGDPCGIGPDVLLTAWNNRKSHKLPGFIATGAAAFLERRSAELGFDTNIQSLNSISDYRDDVLCVFDVGIDVIGLPGAANELDASATIASIDLAVKLVSDCDCSAVVTCPINKHVLYNIGFEHPGHTEYLGELASRITGDICTPVMMIAGSELRTVPVTIHIPLSEVPQKLTTQAIIQTTEITYNDLRNRFGLNKPRIALSGLNPHSGENGALGTEELSTIIPAIKELKERGIEVAGPLPADTMFHKTARQQYDVAICMYHDQALIPAKMIGFDDGVNVTLGLPFVRTSPDHGTAYDIAGTGKANPSSFVAALKLAHDMVVAQ